jgi:hypothetical protein
MIKHITEASLNDGNDFLLAQSVVNILQDFFPGWEWTAQADEGILYFKNLSLSQGWCIQLRYQNLSKRSIRESGGEFLDRFNAPVKFNVGWVESAPTDFTGAIVSEKWTPDRRYYNRTDKSWKAAI